MVGDRLMRVRRRMHRRGRLSLVAVLALVVVVVLAGYGVYAWLTRPTGLAAIPNPAVVAPGGFRASIGANRIITVGLEIRNTAKTELTVTEARVVAPAGLTSVAVTLIAPGVGNQGFALEGDLPASAPVRLGTNGTDRNAIVAARFTVNCAGIAASSGPTGEQIFVTVQLGDEHRVEELTPPVVGNIPWLTATARRACTDPVVTSSPGRPLPPLPTPSARA